MFTGTHKKCVRSAMAGAVLAVCCGAASAAPTVDLTGIGYVQYGDGLSYSMPFANFQAIGDFTPQPGDPFYIASAPGQIANLVVPATGVNGGPVTVNFAGMDDAYETPSGVGGENYFQTGGLNFGGNTYPAPDPGGAGEFTNDFNNTWDATVASLASFLSGEQLVFFFNNNQLNQTQAQQSLAAWGQLWITDAAGNVVDPDGVGGPETGYFEFTNNNSPYALVSEGGGGVPLGDPTGYTSTGRTAPTATTLADGTVLTDYVLSGGELCADAGLNFVDCDDPSAVIGPVNHNLGANNAAYAIVFPELNALLDALIANAALDLTQYTLHIDLRMGCDPTLFGVDPDALICDGELADGSGWGKNLNNGYEQVFIGTAARVQQVPEPAVLTLLGIGMLGLAASRRQRKVSAHG
ncbi:MAG: PEP-CTERM sorting domain-containing protein [Rhodocyclaceae bacterium]|nr:PEP-CTERM sorting domain-containing protein [Rhodocyclaceae bacterium]